MTEVGKKDDYILDRETLERIILKKSIVDKKFLGTMTEYFDERWCEGNRVNLAIMNLAILYMKKSNSAPNFKTLSLMARQYCNSHRESHVKVEDIEAKLMDLKTFEIPDENLYMADLERFVFEQMYYYAVSDSIKYTKSKEDVSKIVSKFEHINKFGLRDDNMGLNYFTREGQTSFWEYVSNPEAKISTGWKNMDNNTHGGFLRDGRMLALFCAQPGLGKSLFLANIAVNFLSQGKTVVVISLEMSENVYCSRFASIISGDNINGLQRTLEQSKKKVEKFYSDHPESNLIVKEYPPKSVRVVDVERYLEKLKENGTKIDVIVVDYLNLLLPNTKEDGMYMIIKAVSEQLRALSYKFNAPVISATQINREGTDNENVGLANISESSGQSATADWIGILHRDDEDRSNGIIHMRVAKNRFGEPGKNLDFRMNGSNLRLFDASSDGLESTESESERITRNLEPMEDDMQDI